MMPGQKKPKQVMKVSPQPEVKRIRECGHPIISSLDFPSSNDGKQMDSICIPCLLKQHNEMRAKLGLPQLMPCSRVQVNDQKDWQDPSKWKVIWNK